MHWNRVPSNMPSVPLYFHRLAEAIQVFEGQTKEWIDRRDVEQVLGVSKTVAWRLMLRCGAQNGPGNTLVCRRDDFVRAVREMINAPTYKVEIRRRERVEDQLEEMARVLHTRASKVAEGEAARGL